MNKNYFNELNEIKNMAKSLRTLNEAVKFAENFEEPEVAPEQAPTDAPAQPEADPSMDGGMEGDPTLDALKGEPQDENDALSDLGEVGEIRELCLRGMIKRCKDANDPHYEALKKILQLCDKAVQEDEEEGQMVRK